MIISYFLFIALGIFIDLFTQGKILAVKPLCLSQFHVIIIAIKLVCLSPLNSSSSPLAYSALLCSALLTLSQFHSLLFLLSFL